MTDIYRTQMMEAITTWMRNLRENYPGWRVSIRKNIIATLYYDDDVYLSLAKKETSAFTFPAEIEKQRVVVLRYLQLDLTVKALKECEFYFRRYPFRGLPVTHSAHISNICEMYFSRCYQIKENIREYFETVKDVVSVSSSDAGPRNIVEDFTGDLIREYKKIFDNELRARNSIHHHERFEDIEISRISLKEILHENFDSRIEQQIRSNEYRKAVRYWVRNVHRGGKNMDLLLEGIARFTLEYCQFLADVKKN